MSARLDVFQDQLGYFVVAWDDEGYPGLELGNSPEINPEHKSATDAVVFSGAIFTTRKSEGTMLFETKSDATKALRAARAALRAAKSATNPMPAWAIKASAEGWKPPKGWKP